MKNYSDKLKNEFENKGYFVVPNIVDKDLIFKLINEIKESKNTIKYFDNKNNLRRIEKLFDKGPELKKLNEKIINLLNNVLNQNFLIFKDKFNAKPPGGEGFFAHYDGIFYFIDQNNNKKKGWYEYGEFFVNVLVALDNCNKENGALEIGKIHKGSFEYLFNNTKKDGTPAIIKEIEDKISFELVKLNKGDMVVFSNRCPHRSKKNISSKNRRILYYTYSLEKNGSKYEAYFNDKKKSKNISKALSEK